jgi:hypothetical protein
MEPKGYQKGGKNDPNGAQRRLKKERKQCSEKVGSMMCFPGFTGTFWKLFARKRRTKGTFLEIPKIRNGTKIQIFSKDRPRDPLKSDPGSGSGKT